MKRVWRIVLGALLLPVAGFCVFGFLASYEPGADSAHVGKALYGVIGIGSLVAAGLLFLRR